MKKPVLFGVLFVLVFLAAVLYSTMNLSRHRVEVCIEYNGRTSCRTASGTTQEFAERTARDNACALIASGVTDTIACQNTTPTSVKVMK